MFVDTSAFIALLDAEDDHHPGAVSTWKGLEEREEWLVTHSYVLVETVAIAQRRYGLDAVRSLRGDVFPAVGVIWVDSHLHDVALSAVAASESRFVSLVDRVSFEVVSRHGCSAAFAYDRHFSQYGIPVIGSGESD